MGIYKREKKKRKRYKSPAQDEDMILDATLSRLSLSRLSYGYITLTAFICTVLINCYLMTIWFIVGQFTPSWLLPLAKISSLCLLDIESFFFFQNDRQKCFQSLTNIYSLTSRVLKTRMKVMHGHMQNLQNIMGNTYDETFSINFNFFVPK